MPNIHFEISIILQGKVKTPFSWAFQKDSELADVFNHHLQKMKETGTMSRMRQEVVQNVNKKVAGKVEDANALSFENVAFPFLVLLTGILLSFVQLGIEFLMFCKKKCACDPRPDDANIFEDDEESREIMEEISKLLRKKCSKPKNVKLLAEIKTIAMPGIKRHAKR